MLNEPASAPESDSVFVPIASSVTTMSATLTDPPFSGVEVTVFVSDTAVGGWLGTATLTVIVFGD